MKRFVPVKTEPLQNGKSNKIPTDKHGRPANAQDPENWMTYKEAVSIAGNAGLVLTLDDPIFCIDLDNYSKNKKTHDEILRHFEGFFIEQSISGDGFHIFGMCDKSKLFKHKQRGDNLEFYIDKRFILTTGNDRRGDIQKRDEGHINEFLLKWGTYDDDAAIKEAYEFKGSAAQKLGYKASFRDLFFRNVDVLSSIYPSDNPNKEFDYSEADLALCDHLGFWFRGDAEKVEHYFELSELVRDKWENRPEYKERTISKACERHKKDAKTTTVTGSVKYLPADQQIDYFSGCYYVADIDKIIRYDGLTMSQSVFNSMYGGRRFELDTEAGKETPRAWEAFTQSRCFDAPKVHSTCFYPKDPRRVIETDMWTYYNTYRPTTTPKTQGDVTLFLTHLQKLFPHRKDREIIISYLAAVLQYPGHKFKWFPIVVGAQGNGKSFITDALIEILTPRLSHKTNPQTISNKFNAWLEGITFCGIEELRVTGHDNIIERFKDLVTGERQQIEKKGIDQKLKSICCNFLATMNPDPKTGKIHFPADKNDRRHAVFITPHKTKEDILKDGMDAKYFTRLWDWAKNQKGWEIIHWYLTNYNIQDEYNPTRSLQRAPEPSCYDDFMKNNVSDKEALILDLIESEPLGLHSGLVSCTMLGKYYKERTGKNLNVRETSSILENLGYETPPSLSKNKGRLHQVSLRDNCKPKLYMKPEHPMFNEPAKKLFEEYENNARN